MGRYNVIVGKEFEVDAVEVEDIDDVVELSDLSERRFRVRMQLWLTIVILISIALALMFAAAVGFHDGSYEKVGAVWTAVALPMGAALTSVYGEVASGKSGKRKKKKRRKKKKE